MNRPPPLKVLVVDDTVVYRKIVSDILGEIPGVQVVGSAHNGKAALLKIASLAPDLLILDIEMPEMNGIEVLEHLQATGSSVGAVMLSTLTHEGGEMTLRALERGAFDFLPKPQGGGMAENKSAITRSLTAILQAYARRSPLRHLRKPAAAPALPPATVPVRPGRVAKPTPGAAADIVAIGISTGGPKALAALLPALPASITAPILIVQHMPPVFTQSLAASLNGKSALRVKEAEGGEPVSPGTVYIAPGGRQMKVVAGGDGSRRMIKITDDPPENNCRPSVDYLFRSVAEHYLGRALGVIMTGMGSDGVAGLRRMRRNGAVTLAQDEASCVVYGMPKAAVEAGIVDEVVPLAKLAHEIARRSRKG